MEQYKLEYLKTCPVCSGKEIIRFLESRDHFLSGHEFLIDMCKNCGHKFTNPRPEETFSEIFYKSQEYISHGNSSNGLFSGLYKTIRKINLQNKYKTINSYCKAAGNLLDIGCGTGEFIRHMNTKGWRTLGIERDNDAREIAVKKNNVDARGNKEIAHLKPESFDVITIWHVLEHIYDLHGMVHNLHNLLRKEGYLFLAVPNAGSWDASFYLTDWAAYDLPRHVHHFNRSSMTALLNHHNLAIVEIIPMKFDAFYISALSEKYKTGKQYYLKGFINGLRSNNFGFHHNNDYSSIIFVVKQA
ncbi:MAG: class I SAM-dependent methyltransferase [Bacteroidales bacterium]|nr:class I SAM-dependent methyltransferase [Bacteroidales bacterium]